MLDAGLGKDTSYKFYLLKSGRHDAVNGALCRLIKRIGIQPLVKPGGTRTRLTDGFGVLDSL